MDSLNWFPKSNTCIRLKPKAQLISQFLNPPKWFDRLFPASENTFVLVSSAALQHQLSEEKLHLIVNIRSKAPKLIRITLLGKRLPGLDADIVLSTPAKYQSGFLAWRRGVLGCGRKCYCSKRFDHGHRECMPYPDALLSDNEQLPYNLDLYLLDVNIKYTLMDFLLNQSLWEIAHKLHAFWILSMSTALSQHSSNALLS